MEVGPGRLSSDGLRPASGLDERFCRAARSSGETTTLDVSEGCAEYSRASCDVDSAALDVERARDPTHSAVAESRPASAGDNETRKSGQEVHDVLSGMALHRCDL